jgi:hypothetical protein
MTRNMTRQQWETMTPGQRAEWTERAMQQGEAAPISNAGPFPESATLQEMSNDGASTSKRRFGV